MQKGFDTLPGWICFLRLEYHLCTNRTTITQGDVSPQLLHSALCRVCWAALSCLPYFHIHGLPVGHNFPWRGKKNQAFFEPSSAVWESLELPRQTKLAWKIRADKEWFLVKSRNALLLYIWEVDMNLSWFWGWIWLPPCAQGRKVLSGYEDVCGGQQARLGISSFTHAHVNYLHLLPAPQKIPLKGQQQLLGRGNIQKLPGKEEGRNWIFASAAVTSF